MSKRILEARPLREFFQEQLDHLTHLLDVQHDRKHAQNELDIAVDAIVDGTDKRLRALSGYREELRGSARGLLDYIETLVTGIPAPYTLSRQAFIENPMLKALFINFQATQQLFNSNPDVRLFFEHPECQGNDYVYAVLFCHRKEKNILGAEIREDILIREVRQTHVSFHDHSIISVADSEESARRAIKGTLFTRIIHHLRNNIIQLRKSVSPEERIQRALDPGTNLENPKVYLQMLSQQLNLPRELIRIQDEILNLNSMGIKQPLEANTTGHTIQYCEVKIGDYPQVATIARYPRFDFS